jgi:hypothetical protein
MEPDSRRAANLSERNFPNDSNLICPVQYSPANPTGKSVNFLSIHRCKNISVFPKCKSVY